MDVFSWIAIEMKPIWQLATKPPLFLLTKKNNTSRIDTHSAHSTRKMWKTKPQEHDKDSNNWKWFFFFRKTKQLKSALREMASFSAFEMMYLKKKVVPTIGEFLIKIEGS